MKLDLEKLSIEELIDLLSEVEYELEKRVSGYVGCVSEHDLMEKMSGYPKIMFVDGVIENSVIK